MIDGLFNNREITIGIWLAAIIISALCWKVSRSAIADVIKATFKLQIIIPLLLSFIPSALVVTVLAYLKLWDLSVLKETIYWVLGTGLAMFGSFTKVDTIKNLYKHTAKAALALVVILQFLVNFYTFPLWAELILWPIIAITVILAEFTKHRKGREYNSARKLFNGIIILVGAIMLIFAAIAFINDSNSLLTYQNLELFLLPMALSLAYVPSVYLIALYSKYQLVFNRMKPTFLNDEISEKDKLFLKLACIRECGLSVKLASEMISYLAINFTNKTTKTEALRIIREFRSKQKSIADKYESLHTVENKQS